MITNDDNQNNTQYVRINYNNHYNLFSIFKTGLKQASLKYFGIFEGFTFPTRKFSCVDKVSITDEGKFMNGMYHSNQLLNIHIRTLYRLFKTQDIFGKGCAAGKMKIYPSIYQMLT